MAATVLIYSYHGSGPTSSDVTGATIYFRTNDADTADAANPIVVPGAGTNYSFPKYLRLQCTVAPSNNITNARFYMDGSGWTGATGVSLAAKASASYTQPVSTAQVSGMSDAFTYTSGSSLTLGAGPYTTTGAIGDYVVLQMGVASTAGAGTTTSELATFAWDES